MRVGLVELTLRLHGCRSLKEKRQVVRSLVDRLRHHFNTAVAEVDYQDEHERALIGIAVVSSDKALVERLLEEVIDYAENNTEAELVGIQTEVL